MADLMADFGRYESIVPMDEVALRFGVQVTQLERFVQGVLRRRRDWRTSMNHLRFPWLTLFIVLVTIAVAASAWWSGAPPALADAQTAAIPPAAPDSAATVTLYAVADATIKTEQAGINYGTTSNLTAFWGGPEPAIQRAVVKFDLSTIPPNAILDHADLKLRLTYATGGTIGRLMMVRAFLVTSGWAESSVTWGNQPSVFRTEYAGISVDTTLQDYTWDATTLAQSWLAGPNYGVELRGPESGSAVLERTFGSREYGDPPPRLIVTYSIPTATPTPTVTNTNTVTPKPPTPTYPPTPTVTNTVTPKPSTNTPTLMPPTPPIGPGETVVPVQKDSWIDQGSPNANHGADTTLYLGRRMGDIDTIKHFGLIQFPIAAPPGDTYIAAARLEAYLNYASDSYGFNVSIQKLTGSWTEMGVTWANRPTAVDVGLAAVGVGSAQGWKSWDVTDLVRQWAATPAENYGLLLNGESLGDRRFSSREGGSPPRLVITYDIDTTPPTNPTISSSTHTPGVWSKNPAVSLSWSGADGTGSGVAGYAQFWDGSPTTDPGTTVNMTSISATSTRYDGVTYFHLRTRDVAGNWSAPIHFGPIQVDTQSPQAITDLEIVPVTGASIRLTWSAPADATSGVAQYDARFNTAPINESNWAASSPLSSLPTPGAPGTPQQVGRSGLADGTRRYFAIKSRDQAGNWSPLSTVRNFLDLGLRPDFYGYQFANYGDTQASDLTADDLARMLGHNAVCYPDPPDSCVPYSCVPAILSQILKDASGGHCDGFTVTSLRFFRQQGNPASYYQAGAEKPHDLLKSNARRHIMYYWTKQLYNPVYAVRVASYTASCAQNVAVLQSALSGYGLDPLDMHIWHTDANGTVGHSIAPYALEDRGGGLWRVWVYDNNAPDSMTNFAEINTSTNIWSYGGWGGGCGSAGNSMGVLPISTYAQTPDDVAASAGASSLLAPDAATARIWLTGAGHVLATDPQGRRIGYEGTELINEIPGANADYILGGLGKPLEPLYTVPEGQEYLILLKGTATAGDPATVLLHGARYAASVGGVRLTPASRDEFTVAAGAESLRYSPGTAGLAGASEPAAVEHPTLTLALNGASEGYSLQVAGADVAPGQTVGMRADLAAGRLTLDGSRAGGGMYDLVIVRSGPDGQQTFVHRNVATAAGDTQTAQFGTWNGQGAITLQVDHGSDGTIDETRTLDNQLSKLYLPIITRTR